MVRNRRNFLRTVAGLGAGLAAVPGLRAGVRHAGDTGSPSPVMVETPDVPSLPWKMVNGVKEFHLVAETVSRRIAPGRDIVAWGYNGSCPGPAIQAFQGDRVRVILENRLPESTSIHWHGLEVPIAMDGTPYISQKPVAPGESFAYEFTLHQSGTFFYHSHGAMQEMMGLIGLFILHPPRAFKPVVQHDFGLILQEWALLPNNPVPNTANMEFNWLTINGKSAPDTTPLLVRQGNRVRIRMVNMGMDHHPMHLHGNTFVVTGSEAGRQPESTWGPANTVLVGVAQARDVEFEANYPGDWMIHCHLPHHMMNSMSDLMGERMITTMSLDDASALRQMQTFADQVKVPHVHHAPVSPDGASVPGFPQDAFMDMGMDRAVARPETSGLADNWSAAMMGMMSLVRVLPPDDYDRIDAYRRGGPPPQTHPANSESEHPHG